MSTCGTCGFETTSDDAFCAGCGSAQSTPVPQAAGAGWNAPTSPGDASAGMGGSGTAPSWAQTVTVGSAARTNGTSNPNGGTGPGYPPPGGGASSPVAAFGRSSAPILDGSDLQLKYMRQTRNACVFIAVIVGIFTALMVVGTIWGIVSFSNLQSQINNGFSSVNNSNCASQGGTNPDC